MLSHKSKYALQALLVLGAEYGNGPMQISDIAEREHIPKRFLELILLELKNHGVLRSKKGQRQDGQGRRLCAQPASGSAIGRAGATNARGAIGAIVMRK